MLIGFFVLLLILFFCCYLPSFRVFHDFSYRVTPAQMCIYIAVGLGSLGMLTICIKAAGIDIRTSIIPGILLSINVFVKHRKKWIPKIQTVTYDTKWFIAFGVSAIYFLHVLIPGVLMGIGEYPAVFFNVDSPYYLGQIHALVQSNSWPPGSLSFLGGSFGYHYGTQSISALLSVLTGFPPHTSAFLIYMPLITLGIICVSWEIVRQNKINDFPIWIGILILLFSVYYPFGQIVSIIIHQTFFNIDPTLVKFKSMLLEFKWMLLNPETFSNSYPMLSTQFGIFSAITVIYCLQNIYSVSRQRLAVFIVGISILFKSPYVIPLGLGFGFWMLLEAYRTSRITLLLSPLIALLIGLFFYLISNFTQSVTLVIVFFQLMRNQRLLWDIMGSMIIYGIPLYLTYRCKVSLSRNYHWHYLLFIVPPLIFVNTFGLMIEIKKIYSSNLFQTLYLIPMFWGMFVFIVIKSKWPALTYQIRKLTIIAVVLVSIAPVGHKLILAFIPLVSPEHGHEFVDNHYIAEALEKIPVKNTVIVTNDFRYPAENYSRDLRQMQIPSLFGHQAYAVNFVYENYPDSKNRLDQQYKFRDRIWDPELMELAQKLGWTHLLIHRDAPHSDHIPLEKIFENKKYYVYVFKVEA